MSAAQLRTMLQEVEKSVPATYWAKRIIEELSYLLELSEGRGRELDDAILPGIQLLQQRVEEDQAITPATVQAVEEKLADLSEQAKALTVVCTANAHIDMNWMWGYQETVALTVDTLRTVLTLMDEYPDFVYTQPQASVYAIVEEFAPELLEKIRQRVAEGRWEASVSGWVEHDKNMSSTESMARHLLYGKRYISNLLNIPEDQLDLDFAPDTFGHSRHIPELIANGGIKYYYHCRGHEGPNLFRFRAASGAEVIAFREPAWYNLSIDYGMMRYVPGYCANNGVDTILHIYGVGDHGGGPTRRDLERIRDMQSWPLFPTLEHASVREFFLRMEKYREKLPVVQQELNYVFTGCYTSQSRIKRANRYGEAKLYDAEALEVMANAWDPSYRTSDSENSWRKILFNQFHDILPGSGTVETREYAMGEFQGAMAWTETTAKRAMQCIAAKVAGGKEALPEVGVGNFTDDANGYGISGTGFVGDKRYYIMYNTTTRARSEMTELTLWDWQHSMEHICITDENGAQVPYQVTGTGTIFWGHSFVKILLPVKVPAMGYSVCCVSYAAPDKVHVPVDMEPRVDRFSDANFVLENENLKAEFDRKTMQCVSLIHKATGKQMVDPARPGCGFEWVTEEPLFGMSSWRIGPEAKVVNLNETEPVFVTDICLGNLRQKISYYITFGRSRLDVSVGLDKGSDQLDISVKADWHELGNQQEGIPMLRMPVSLGYDHSVYRNLTAGGCVDRPAIAHDVPSHGLSCAVANEGVSLAVLSDCKYGFRNWENTTWVSLLRSPFDPDTCPDQGVHYIKLALKPMSADPADLEYAAAQQMHPITSCVVPAEEQFTAKMSDSLFALTGGTLTALKKAEDGKAILLRVNNPADQESTLQITFNNKVSGAYLTDVREASRKDLPCDGNTVVVKMAANTSSSVGIVL